MTANKSAKAIFALPTYPLSVSLSGDGSGTVTSNPAGINCGSTCSASFTENTSVTLTASPASGSIFGGWSGACSGTGSCTINMNNAQNVTALFTHLNASAMLGAYVDYDGWNTSVIDSVNAAMVKPLAVINLFTNFDQGWSNLTTQATNIVSRNAVPMITWMPSVPTRPDANLLGEISSGQWDTYIDTWISGLKTWQANYPVGSRPTVLIRFAHEFNGNWYPWGNDPNGLKTAWAYLRNRFAAAGVSGVEWVWCANNASVDNYNDITRYYPGDTLVDWTALDGYNWGSNYSFSQWKGFAETFSSPYITLVTNYPTKPVILAEVASAEPSDLPNAAYGQDGNDSDASQGKEAWVQDMYTRIMNEYPAIRAVAWFNTNKELSWALTGASNTGLTAYNNVVADSYYTGTFIPSGQTATSSAMTTSSLSLSSTTQPTSVTVQNTADDTRKVLALSRLPTVVGEALLKREARGFKNLSTSALDALKAIKRRTTSLGSLP
jgi:beta-mannanase